MDILFSLIRTAPFLFILILFIFVFTRLRNKSSRQSEQREKEFWDKELRANSTRKKNIDDLDYIHVPYDKLFPTDPASVLAEPSFMKAAEDISALSGDDVKILNLNGISNTDLKLTYGTANITVLSEADNNYTSLIAALTHAGLLCHEKGLDTDARRILEYSVEIGSDAAAAYTALCEIYRDTLSKDECQAKIQALKSKVSELTSIRRDAILSKLESFS